MKVRAARDHAYSEESEIVLVGYILLNENIMKTSKFY